MMRQKGPLKHFGRSEDDRRKCLTLALALNWDFGAFPSCFFFSSSLWHQHPNSTCPSYLSFACSNRQRARRAHTTGSLCRKAIIANAQQHSCNTFIFSWEWEKRQMMVKPLWIRTFQLNTCAFLGEDIRKFLLLLHSSRGGSFFWNPPESLKGYDF